MRAVLLMGLNTFLPNFCKSILKFLIRGKMGLKSCCIFINNLVVERIKVHDE